MEGTIRPWYRSRLFWLGVPGLVFLIWMSVTSLFSSRGFQARLNPRNRPTAIGITIVVDSNSLVTWAGEIPGFFRTPRTGVDFWTESKWMPVLTPEERLTNPIRWNAAENLGRGLQLESWFVIGVYLLVWMGPLVWWQRRKSRRDSNQ